MTRLRCCTRILAVPLLFGWLTFGWWTAGLYAQGAAASCAIGEPPSPVTITDLAYPKLTGIWAATPMAPSLSEKFNAMLPSWLRFSGEFRERLEGYSGGFRPGSTNDYDLERIRLGVEIQPTRWLNFYIQMQDARPFGVTPALPPNQNAADIREAYAEIGNPEGNGFTVKAGRQEITFGNNRLIGDSWWSNAARSFDAVRATYQQGRLRNRRFRRVGRHRPRRRDRSSQSGQ